MEPTHTPLEQQVIPYSLVFLLALGVLTAFGGAGETPSKGGTMRVGMIAEPYTLDMHWQPERSGQLIAYHFLEGLYTQGLDYGWIPMLAEGHTVSDDGLVYTIRLRRGVPFHHGKELTAADAVASLQRYGRLTGGGRRLFPSVESVRALDQYTVQLRLQGKTALVLPLLRTAIYPREVVEEAGEGQIRTHIGTGPFKLAELQPGRVKLVRFEPYQARAEPPNGFGGGKTAWVDTLLFLYIPDDSVRMATLESGDVDITWGMHEAYDRLKAHPDLKVQIEKPGRKFGTVLNKQKGLFTNVKLRQAALAALDMEPIMQAAVGHPQFYRLDSSLSHKEEPWWTDAGGELYNQKNPEKARRLLKEAGYRGEPVRYMAAHDAVAQHRVAPATKQQLEAVGFTVELQLMEWSTLARLRRNPDLWDAHTAWWGIAPDPTLSNHLRCDQLGWNCDPDFAKLLQAMETELLFERRYRLWQDIHRLFWDRVPYILYGDTFWLTVMRKHVHGPFDMPWWYFWNVWLDK
jgi:peptide/nickel transport system substrate-binding protein